MQANSLNSISAFYLDPGTRNRIHVHRTVGMHAYVSGSYTQNEVTSPMFFVHVSEFKQARHFMIKISTLYMQPW